MSDFYLNTLSVYRGIRAYKYRSSKAQWCVKLLPKRFWFHAWTPIWHSGRGPYLSCGIWLFAIYRGY